MSGEIVRPSCPDVSKTIQNSRSARRAKVVYTLFSETILLIGLLLTAVCQGNDASRRHDGRWNLLSIGARRSVRLTCSITRIPAKCASSSKAHLALSNMRKMLQDGICDTTDILNSVPPKKVFIAFFLLSEFLLFDFLFDNRMYYLVRSLTLFSYYR